MTPSATSPDADATCPCCGQVQRWPATDAGPAEEAACAGCGTRLRVAETVACSHCGQIQRVPTRPRSHTAKCCRCHLSLSLPETRHRSRWWCGTLALAALALYPAAMLLPILSVEQLGQRHAASIIEGCRALIDTGDATNVFVGIVILAFSVVLPLGKLITLLVCTQPRLLVGLGGPRTSSFAYRLVEWTGRLGMLDVLLLALLVALIKLGDVVSFELGTALFPFIACVTLSLLASAAFDPRALWADERANPRAEPIEEVAP